MYVCMYVCVCDPTDLNCSVDISEFDFNFQGLKMGCQKHLIVNNNFPLKMQLWLVNPPFSDTLKYHIKLVSYIQNPHRNPI